MPAPQTLGRVARNQVAHITRNNKLDLLDCIAIGQLIATNHTDAALARLADMARRNMADIEIGLLLETGELSRADDVIMDFEAERRKREKAQ